MEFAFFALANCGSCLLSAFASPPSRFPCVKKYTVQAQVQVESSDTYLFYAGSEQERTNTEKERTAGRYQEQNGYRCTALVREGRDEFER